MYEDWCEKAKVRPWPTTERVFIGFLDFAGSLYSLGSVRDVIAASVKRLHIEICGCSMDLATVKACSALMRKLSARISSSVDRMHALLAVDVAHIINSTPDWWLYKPAEASLLLFATGCGARAITCAAVRLCDIVRIVPSSECSGATLVTMNLVRTKGKENWNHKVTFEGSVTEQTDGNFVFWLAKHVFTAFGVTWEELQKRSTEKRLSEQKLWHWSNVAMNAVLKQAAHMAGYPNIFTFHSCRRGA